MCTKVASYHYFKACRIYINLVKVFSIFVGVTIVMYICIHHMSQEGIGTWYISVMLCYVIWIPIRVQSGDGF
jgi:hypothetical protein